MLAKSTKTMKTNDFISFFKFYSVQGKAGMCVLMMELLGDYQNWRRFWAGSAWAFRFSPTVQSRHRWLQDCVATELCGPPFIKTMQRLFIDAALFAKFSGLQSDRCSTLQNKMGKKKKASVGTKMCHHQSRNEWNMLKRRLLLLCLWLTCWSHFTWISVCLSCVFSVIFLADWGHCYSHPGWDGRRPHQDSEKLHDKNPQCCYR